MLRKYFKYIFPIILIMGVLPFVFIKRDKDTLSLLEEKDMLAYTIDGVSVGSSNMPAKGSGYVVSSITCKNGSKLVWDNDNWELEMVTLEDFDSCVIDFTTDKTKSSTMVTLTSTESLVDKVDSTSKTPTVQTPVTFYVTEGYIVTEISSCNSTLNDDQILVNSTSSSQDCNTNIKRVYTLAEAILRDNPTISERTDFSVTNTANTTRTIYKTNKTEDGSDVYYYSGITDNNYVAFGLYPTDLYSYYDSSAYLNYVYTDTCPTDKTCTKIYSKNDPVLWRIIRTNEDGSVRLLYTGKWRFIGKSSSSTVDLRNSYTVPNGTVARTDTVYGIGYIYGKTDTTKNDSLENSRNNDTDSYQKKIIDGWYESNFLTNYDKYVSKSAIYCDDRSRPKGNSYGYSGFYMRAESNKPSYKCGSDGSDGLFESTQAIADKFSASTNGGGNGQLKYPIALMTADEVVFAGGKLFTAASTDSWFVKDYDGATLLMGYSTYTYMGGGYQRLLVVENGKLTSNGWSYPRPVLSIDKCAYVTGTGTPDDPYVIDETNSTC